MKLPATAGTYSRWAPAVLRNCLSHECAPLDCPIRKCRRDGLCSGPLISDLDGMAGLVPADGKGVPPDATLAPICYLHIPDAALDRVNRAYRADLRRLIAEPGATVIETSRAIASRRWRRLDGLEG